MALTYVKDINAYVEEQAGYSADRIAVHLDEPTFHVTAYPVDEAGNKLSGASNIVDTILADLPSAIAYYEKIVGQADEGDIIRNV